MRYSEFRIKLIELSDSVRRQIADKWRKENSNLTDAQINYYLDRWDRYASGFDKQYRDITRLTFAQVEQLVDHAEARAELKGKNKPQQQFDQNDDMIYNRNNLVILKGDLREKCIQYGRGYKWCISRSDASNLFFNYRMRNNEPMFYFVFDKDRPKDDVWHAVVIYVDNNNIFHVATANNPGDVPLTWEEIERRQPKLRGLQKLFVPQPLTSNERSEYEKFKNPRSLRKYLAMSLKDKIKYIKFGHALTNEQQAATDDIDLLGLYAKNMPTNITKDTYRRIKSGDRRKIVSDLLQLNDPIKLTEFSKSIETAWHDMGLPEDLVIQAETRIANSDYAVTYAQDVIKGRWPEGERAIAESPPWAFAYAQDIIKGRFPKGERAIAESPLWAFAYAQDIIKGRFPKGERAIAESPKWAFVYARDIIKGRWPEGERAIAQDPDLAYDYAAKIINGRFPEGERAIAHTENPDRAFEYARNIIKGRWPKGERAIAESPKWAFVYARDIIKGRWPEGERAITQDSELAYDYAAKIINGRWSEGERAIAQDPDIAFEYARFIINGRFPEGESVIARNSDLAYEYAAKVIKGRWPEGERAIAGSPYWAFAYARDIIKGRWPEGEKAIAGSPDLKRKYEEEFDIDLDSELKKKNK